MNKNEIIIEKLQELYPDAKPALIFSNNYELLVSVILSAQCTDERVNKVTGKLFKDYGTPQKMVTLSKEQLAKKIYECGLNNSKAEHILLASQDIIDKFGGEVPGDWNDLLSLPGVGRKTANVVYAVGFGGAAIAVDTHVFRVSNRIGISKGKTPLEVEKGLMNVIPKDLWLKMHHALIWHGRKVCKAQKPDCGNCVINMLCEYCIREK